MKTQTYPTLCANQKRVESQWLEIDGAGQTVGRLASQIAYLLRGKHKPYYTPHVDCGDHVIVTNADKVIFTGDKEKKKHYISHTGYPGGQRVTTPERIRLKTPLRILEHAIKGMLPKNRLGRALFRKLYTYDATTHPHHAQKPKKMTLPYLQ